jgi:hypothetical protein
VKAGQRVIEGVILVEGWEAGVMEAAMVVEVMVVVETGVEAMELACSPVQRWRRIYASHY